MMGQPFCEALEIPSGMITCLEVTTFSGITNFSELTSLSEVTVSLAEVACSAKNSCVKGVGTKGTRTESSSTSNTYVESDCTKVASDVDVYICVAGLKGTCIGNACTCSGSTGIGA